MTEAVTSLVAELGSTPLIGFAGGPFTLACYLVDGGPSKNYEITKSLMYGQPALWDALMTDAHRHHDQLPAGPGGGGRVGGAAVRLLGRVAQPRGLPPVGAAAQPADLRRRWPGPGVPRIHFGVGTGELLRLMGEAGADVVGVDWRVPLDEAARRVGPGRALQGNLDPALLLAPWPVIEERAGDVLDRGRAAEGHVFNLGHGVLPSTDPGVLARLVDYVHAASREHGGRRGPRPAPGPSSRWPASARPAAGRSAATAGSPPRRGRPPPRRTAAPRPAP